MTSDDALVHLDGLGPRDRPENILGKHGHSQNQQRSRTEPSRGVVSTIPRGARQNGIMLVGSCWERGSAVPGPQFVIPRGTPSNSATPHTMARAPAA